MKLKNIKFLYSFFILILYLLFGILLLFKYLVLQEVPSYTMASFGIVIMAYGFFRGYRAYKLYQNSNEEQDEGE